LSFAVSLLMLLSALSVQTAALHARSLVVAELRQRQQEDALAAAAQQVAARLSGSHACLLPLAYTEPAAAGGKSGWDPPLQGCPADLDPLALVEGTEGEHFYTVVAWRPGDPVSGGRPGDLRLRLAAPAGERQSNGQQGLERLYALSVEPLAAGAGALHVVNVRGMGR
jgi:hypothetical protein